jgi:1-acyl-sn-glycerol-3-phosphate acyltransferase
MSSKELTSADEMVSYDDVYQTTACRVSPCARVFPSCSFYRKFIWNVYRSSVKARRGTYDDLEWIRSSHQVLKSLESVGVRFELSGLDHIHQLKSPCVFVANHMSMLETTVLPAIIQPIRDVTFVVKQSLLQFPVFRHVMRARNPIAVSRDDPREDFIAVMRGGSERLKKGISILVFPQSMRSLTFDPFQFNTLGVKLAQRAKVPVVPIALKTDAWGNGKWFTYLGPIDPNKVVHIAFGEPIVIEGRGAQQHQEIISYIAAKLGHWSAEGNPG